MVWCLAKLLLQPGWSTNAALPGIDNVVTGEGCLQYFLLLASWKYCLSDLSRETLLTDLICVTLNHAFVMKVDSTRLLRHLTQNECSLLGREVCCADVFDMKPRSRRAHALYSHWKHVFIVWYLSNAVRVGRSRVSLSLTSCQVQSAPQNEGVWVFVVSIKNARQTPTDQVSRNDHRFYLQEVQSGFREIVTWQKIP